MKAAFRYTHLHRNNNVWELVAGRHPIVLLTKVDLLGSPAEQVRGVQGGGAASMRKVKTSDIRSL